MLQPRSRASPTRARSRRARACSQRPGTDWAHSIVGVPIIGSDRVLGAIGLQNHEREYAFGEDDVRLLQTVAASMGVALENARLFDETQRLLKETEQRNAELAVINSIQQGSPAELDFQGDRRRWSATSCARCSRSDDIGIRWYDDASRPDRTSLYGYEHGERLRPEPVAPIAAGARGVQTRPRVSRSSRTAGAEMVDGATFSTRRTPSACRSLLAVPIIARRPHARRDHASRASSASMPSAPPRSACSRRSLRA